VATFALIAVGALTLFVAVLFGALVELFRDVRQIRDAVGILDRPREVDLGDVAGTRPSSHGLPQELDALHSAIVLFLSERCGTCHALAAGLSGALPYRLWVVIEGRDTVGAARFAEEHGLSGERVTIDVEGAIAASMGLATAPVGFRVDDGIFTTATTVPSSRYLFSSLLQEPVRLMKHVG
jgi:hypothetical protein